MGRMGTGFGCLLDRWASPTMVRQGQSDGDARAHQHHPHGLLLMAQAYPSDASEDLYAACPVE